jgi:hypothetical protein
MFNSNYKKSLKEIVENKLFLKWIL